MQNILDDTKRIAIATQLAEMKALQTLLLRNEQILMNTVGDDNIRQQLQEMLEQDQKNLAVLDSTITQYGIQSQPTLEVEENLKTIQGYMEDSEFPLAEKVFRHELLKHQQTMTGEVIHKAAQIVGADVEMAIAPLHTVNFENRAHQERLKGILEILGVQELTGQSPDQGLWARTEDAIAALTGVAGSVVTRTDDEMSIRDLLLMDHSKTDVLFAEILASDDPQKIQEYFAQLYQDVRVHGLAEEQVLYPAVHPYYEQMPEIIAQTDEVIEMLDAMQPLDPAAPNFKAQVEQLRVAVRNHIDQEEHDIFPKLQNNFSHAQQKQLATEFKTAKSDLQKQQQDRQPQKTSTVMQSQSHQNRQSQQVKTGFVFLNNAIPWKLVFQSKAIINWVEAIVFLVGDRWIRNLLQTQPLVNSEYSQLFYGIVFIIGIGYWWVGQDIEQNQGIVKLGIFAQYSVFAILAYHTVIGSLHPLYLISGVLDLVFAILFSLFLFSSRARLTPKNQ